MADLSVNAPQEGVKPLESIYGVARGVGAALLAAGMLAATPVKIADTVSATLTVEQTSVTENAKIADTVSATLTPEQASVTESLKLDDFGQVDLYGLGATVKVTDGPPAAQLVSVIAPNALQENLKIQDTVTAVLTTLLASGFDESLKLADSVSTLINPEQTTPSDTLKIADIVLGPTLDPEQAASSESLKVQDTVLGPTINPEQASQSEALKVQDSVTVLLGSDLATLLSESLRVADVVTGPTLDPELATLLDYTAPTDMFIWWKFDEGTGTTAADSSGNGNTATVVGGSWYPAKVGASAFDLADLGLTFASVDLGLSHSATAWVNWYDTDGVLIGGVSGQYLLYIDATNVYYSAGSGNFATVPHGGITSGVWTHLGVTRDNTTVKFYRDGFQLGSTQTLGSNVSAVVSRIGSNVGGGFTTTARVDDIRIFTRQISDGEVTSVYNYTGLVAEFLKVQDNVIASLSAASALNASATESLTLADTVSPTINPEQANTSEALTLADIVFATLNPELASTTDSLKVQDVVLVSILDPEQTSITDTLKIADVLIASLNPLSTSTPVEALIVADTGSGTLDPLLTTVSSESLKIADTPIAFIGGVSAVAGPESVKIADTVTALLNPLSGAPPQEVLKLDDFGQVDLYGLGATVKVSDGPPIVQLFSGLSASTNESVKVADTVLGPILDPEQASAPAEALKIADTPTASLASGSDLSANVNESIKVADQPNAALTLLLASSTESLKVADQVIPSITPLLAPVANELLHLTDTVDTAVGRDEILRLSDGPVIAALAGNDLLVTVNAEALKLADSQVASLNPEQSSQQEDLKLQDTVAALLSPLQTFVTDSLKVQDSASATMDASDLAASTSEALKVQDVSSALLTTIQASAAESLGVQDVSGTLLNPLQTSLNEALTVQDTVATGVGISGSANETGKLADTVFAVIDPEQASLAEVLKLSEQLTARLDTLRTSVTEQLIVADGAPSGLVTPLVVNVSENLRVQDLTPRSAGPAVIDVVGSYVTSIDVIGSFVTSIDVLGGE